MHHKTTNFRPWSENGGLGFGNFK